MGVNNQINFKEKRHGEVPRTLHEGMWGKYRNGSTHSLTSALGGGECSTCRPDRFTPRKRPEIANEYAERAPEKV